MRAQANTTSMVFNCLLWEEDGMWIGHCLELDIVATSEKMSSVKKDLGDLILTQVDYAFSNDNLDNLYHPAPPEVWKQFYACKEQNAERKILKTGIKKKQKKDSLETFVPPWIVAQTCLTQEFCSV